MPISYISSKGHKWLFVAWEVDTHMHTTLDKSNFKKLGVHVNKYNADGVYHIDTHEYGHSIE